MWDLWWPKWHWGRFFRVLRFPLPILFPPTAPYSSSSIIRCWYNRSISGWRIKWAVSPHPKKLKKSRHRRPVRISKDITASLSLVFFSSYTQMPTICTSKQATRVISHFDNLHFGNRDSAVGIPTSYGMDDWGVRLRVPIGSTILSPPRRPDRPWSPPSLLFNRHWGLLRRPGREADHLLPTSAEMKKTWIYTFTPSYIFLT
jgi:hypothetical protein